MTFLLPPGIKGLKELPHLLWQNKYSNLKTTCHVNPKWSLWAKFLENSLLMKYLVSVAAALNIAISQKENSRGEKNRLPWLFLPLKYVCILLPSVKNIKICNTFEKSNNKIIEKKIWNQENLKIADNKDKSIKDLLGS